MHLHRSIRSAFSLVVALATLLTALSVGLVLTAGPASATPTEDEKVFVALINRTRADQGLAPLTVHAELTSAARDWSSAMATSDNLSHSPDMTVGVTATWTVLGENVGVHGIHNVEELFDAFVASPTHYRNLVDPRFNYVGVGVVHSSNGKLWTTHRFMAAGSATLEPDSVELDATPADPPQNPSPPTTTPKTSDTDSSTSEPVSTEPATTDTTPSPTTPLDPPTTNAPDTSAPAGDNPSQPAVPSTSPGTDPPSAPTSSSDPANDGQDGATPTVTVEPATTVTDTSPNQSTGDDSNDGDTSLNGDRNDRADGPVVSNDMTDLVQPDEQTVESVLIDLMLAGI